jgi:hypothetical protein
MDDEEEEILKRKKARKLIDIDIDEVSLVPAGANRHKFAIIKVRESMDIKKAIEEFFKVGDPEEKLPLEQAVAELSEDAKSAITKALALLKGYMKDMPPDVAKAIGVLAAAVGSGENGKKKPVKPADQYGYGYYPPKSVQDLAKSGDPWPSVAVALAGGAGYLVKAAEVEDDPDENPEVIPAPRRGLRKSLDGQDGDDEPEEVVVDKWPSL